VPNVARPFLDLTLTLVLPPTAKPVLRLDQRLVITRADLVFGGLLAAGIVYLATHRPPRDELTPAADRHSEHPAAVATGPRRLGTTS
jgi:hypothetical protein